MSKHAVHSALIGGGVAWFASKRGKNRNIGSPREPLMLCNRAGKACPEAIIAESFSYRDAFGMDTFDGPPAPSGKVSRQEPLVLILMR